MPNCYRVVCDTAKVRFFKQITTVLLYIFIMFVLFAILQKYDFSSKSQLINLYFPTANKLFAILQKYDFSSKSQLYRKGANLGLMLFAILQKYDFSSKSQPINYNGTELSVVCDTAKVRFFKQITTILRIPIQFIMLFAILQKYDFSSKSQQDGS